MLTPEAKAKKAKTEKEQEQEEETPQLALFPEQVQQDILPDLIEDDDTLREYHIIASANKLVFLKHFA